MIKQMRLTELYLFECSETERYAFSVDRAGCNLPRSACRNGWVLRAQFKPGDLIEDEYTAVIDATSDHGFCLLENVPPQWVA